MPLAKCYGPWQNLKLELPFECHVDTRDISSFQRQEGVKYVYIDSEPPWACTPLDELVKNAPRYDAIMTTYNEEILERIPNSFFHHVRHDPYMDPSYKPEFNEKKFCVSYLVSNWSESRHGFWIRKPATELLLNHSVPHKVYSGRRTPYPNIELLPQTYPPEVLDDYNKTIIFDAMFSIATENHIQKNHWQEKPLGCFWTRTVPIYFGCPNISDFGFREDGILRFNTIEELADILDRVSPELYEEMKEAVEHNFQVAMRDYSISQHVDIANAIRNHFEENE
jgi:hypothetical protein|tara:strand:+ start:2276 stop:3118 length:843 start_codon:yes stop_codon:yes gene_type:complete